MHKFEWKRKKNSCKSPSPAFAGSMSVEDDSEEELDLPRKKSSLALEDAASKSKRLKREGVILAESAKWWSAVQKWSAAAALQPADHTLLEMMAQAYIQVGEYVASIRYAEQAVAAAPLWWCGHQTLGRALMGIGELHRAVLCFSRSLRLQPDNPELREHDLKWAAQLLSAFKELQKNKAKLEAQKPPPVPEKPPLEIIDLKLNPESCTEEEPQDRAQKASERRYPTPKTVASNSRLSLTGSSRFISSCNSSKSEERDDGNKIEEKPVDLSKMVCMRPKLPER